MLFWPWYLHPTTAAGPTSVRPAPAGGVSVAAGGGLVAVASGMGVAPRIYLSVKVSGWPMGVSLGSSIRNERLTVPGDLRPGQSNETTAVACGSAVGTVKEMGV